MTTSLAHTVKPYLWATTLPSPPVTYQGCSGAGTSTTGDDPGSASYTAGNTIGRPAPGGGEQELVWDELNQLTEVTKNGTTVATMVYDAAGGRLGHTTTLYVAGSEISLNGGTGVVSANRYYSHAGQIVAVRTGASNDTVTTLVADWQGKVTHTGSPTYEEKNRRAFVARQRAAKELLLRLPRRGVLRDIFGYNR